MSFSKLTPMFRESLRETIDKMASEKKAQCGCGGGGLQVSPGAEKKHSVDELMAIVQDVNTRLVADWLYALDDGSREEVKRLFGELQGLSAAEFVLLMKSSGACCPWAFIGSMFSAEDESTQAPNEEIVIVEESGGTAI